MPSTISFRDCRAAARAVRAAPHGREALAVARPRSVLGLVRSRGPLPVVLLVAAAEGRLVWQGPDSFALLERPVFAARPAAARGGFGLRVLRLVDRKWDALLFAVPPGLLLAAAAVLALVSTLRGTPPPLVLVWLAIAAATWAAVFMLAQVVHQTAWARRALGRSGPAPDEIAAETYPGWNWSIPLCHHTADETGWRLLRLAGDRMSDLVREQARRGAERDGAEADADALRVREVLVCLTRGVTTDAMRRTVGEALHQPYGAGSRIALRLPPDPVKDYRAPVRAGGGFFFFWLGGVAVILLVLASVVPSWERQACAGDCAGAPLTFGAALRWLSWRLVFSDAPGLAPRSLPTQVIGWLLGLVGLMTIPVTWVSARLGMAAHRRVLDDFDRLKEPLTNTRLLLLTVTTTERQALLAAARDHTGRAATRQFSGNTVVYELGAVGTATLGMAQCARPGAGAPGGAQATATEVIDRWKPDFVIMVGICCGLREDWTPPHRLGDVIVATSVFDLDHRIENEDSVELLGDRASSATALIARLQAASTDWPDAPVHFGPVLSSHALLNSATRREQLKLEHSRALAYEMEGHGLYAAAADAGVPWILVKAVSDWGVDRDAHYLGPEAAANAAGFVLHAVAIGAFDRAAA